MSALASTQLVHGHQTSSIISIKNNYEMQVEVTRAGNVLSMVIKENGKVVMEFDEEQAKAFQSVIDGIAGHRFCLLMDEIKRIDFFGNDDEDCEDC